MEISTFSLFESARRGLAANQVALNVVSQNISNASTEGYTRQEVIMKNTPPSSYTTSMGATSVGTGVEVSEIRQVRDNFIDGQIRYQSSLSTYWSTKQDYLERVQTFIAEGSDAGMKNLLDKFWKATEDLSNYPQSQATRQAMIQAGEALTSGVKYMNFQIGDIEKTMDANIEQKVNDVNTLARKIAGLNESIIKLANSENNMGDLRDERTRLMKELSKLVKIDVTGTGQIDDGQILINGRALVNNETYNQIEFLPDVSGAPNLHWKNEANSFSSDSSVISGFATPEATSANYSIDVKNLSSAFSVDSKVDDLEGRDLISKIKGVNNGTLIINGTEFKIDATTMTLDDLVKQINQSGTQVSASIDSGGKFHLNSKNAGEASKINILGGTSNLFQVLGIESSLTGVPVPKISDENASLNISGSFRINGRHVKIVQGQTDSLARIVSEINYNSPETVASLAKDTDGSYKIKIAAKDGYSRVEINDSTENLLYRLGLLTSPQTSIKVDAANTKAGQDAKFVINNTEYKQASNKVTDNIKGVTFNLNSTGSAQLNVRPAISGGELGALLETRDATIPGYLDKMGEFIRTFSAEINKIHSEGFDLRGEGGRNFFNPINYDPETSGQSILSQFAVNEELKNDPSKLAAAAMDEELYMQTGLIRSMGPGDNTTALRYSEIRTKSIFADGSNMVDKYGEVLASIGDVLDTAQKTGSTQKIILNNIELKKESISGVSIDEEVANMLKYQHAYDASAKVMNVIDGMIDTIINKLIR